jgi:hypothetical protein
MSGLEAAGLCGTAGFLGAGGLLPRPDDPATRAIEALYEKCGLGKLCPP